jgi:gliding motility-associated lipoprotein GldH
MKRGNRLLFFLLILGMASCNPDRIFEEYHGMPELRWNLADTVSFEIEVTAPNAARPLIGLRYNDTYEFHNLYVRYLLTDSLGKVLGDSLINLHLFDPKSGKPLGTGFGNVYTKYDTLPDLGIPQGQKQQFRFIQYMRTEELKGIEAVGLKISRK